MARPALVIFDCDGVLVDSEPIANRVLHGLLVERGVAITPEQTHRHFIGTSSSTFLSALAALDARIAPEPFLDRFRHHLLAAFARELKPVDGAIDLVTSLTVPSCVASNSSRVRLMFSLEQTGLLALFAGRVFSADDVARPKPAPDLFLHAARAMVTEPADCVVIEDTTTGVQAARAAGMHVLGYTATVGAAALQAAGAHRVFDTMAECAPLLSARFEARSEG